MMQKTSCIKLLQSFSKKELKAFDLYLHALYPRKKIILSTFDFIKKYHPHFDAKQLKRECLLKVFRGTNKPKARNKSFDNTLSKLKKLQEEFLLWKKIKEHDGFAKRELISIFRERGLDDLYFQSLDKTDKTVEAKAQKNMWDYLHLLQSNYDRYYHSNTSKINTSLPSLEKIMNYLDCFFISAKLKISCEMKNRENILQEKYQIQFLEEAIAHCHAQKKENNFLSNLYLLFLDLFEKKEKSTFNHLKNIVLHKRHNLNPNEELILLTYLINFTSIAIKKGELDYYQEAFILYQFGLQNKIFAEDGYITPSKFINIVRVSSKVKNFEWVEKFIHDLKDHLHSSIRQSVVSMSYAYLHFEKGAFNETISQLINVQFEDDYFSLRARGIILKCYYELYHLSNPDLIQSHCNSFAMYLNRNITVSDTTIKSYFSLVRFVRLFLRKRISQEELLKEVADSQYIFSKRWILEKITQFD